MLAPGLLAILLAQAPSSGGPPPTANVVIPTPVAAPAPAEPVADYPAPVYYPAPGAQPPNDPTSLGIYLAQERQYAWRLGYAMNEDLRRHWIRYADDEEDKARDRAEGDDDDDLHPQGFGDYLDDKYRKRRNLGITLFAVGFAPVGFGLYTGLTLGGAEPLFGLAAVGGAVIVSGAVVTVVHSVKLRRLRKVRASLDASAHARVQWRGLAPTYDPRSRTHGLSVGFAF